MHGDKLRGLEHTPRSSTERGRFGRMFRSLPAAKHSQAALHHLAESMIQAPDQDKPITEGDWPIEKDADLQCTRSGQVLDDLKGKSVFDLNAALATELRKVGAEVDEFPDGLRITPRPLHGAEIETYNDHRIAMSMALIGLKVPGIIIKNPGCVAKTYPGFWDDLEKLRS